MQQTYRKHTNWLKSSPVTMLCVECDNLIFNGCSISSRKQRSHCKHFISQRPLGQRILWRHNEYKCGFRVEFFPPLLRCNKRGRGGRQRRLLVKTLAAIWHQIWEEVKQKIRVSDREKTTKSAQPDRTRPGNKSDKGEQMSADFSSSSTPR